MKKIYPSAVESGATTPRAPGANESTPLHLNNKGTQVTIIITSKISLSVFSFCETFGFLKIPKKINRTKLSTCEKNSYRLQ